MLQIIGTFTVQEKITLLAWTIKAQVDYTMDALLSQDVAEAKQELPRAQEGIALLAGLCTGNTTDQEILDFVEFQDFAAQMECVLDCRTEQEMLDMDPALVAAFHLCVRLGVQQAWTPWQ